MNCRTAQSQLSAFADGELTGAQMMRLNHHLSECPTCQSELDMVLEVKFALASLQVVAPRPELKDRLLSAIEAEQARKTVRVHPAASFFATAAAAAALVFVFLQVQRTQISVNSSSATPGAQLNIPRDQATMVADDPFSTSAPVYLASQRGE